MVFFVKGHLNQTNRALCSHKNGLIILHKDKSPFSLESKAGWPSSRDAVDGIPVADTRPPVAFKSLSNSKIQLFYHFKCWLAKVKVDLIVLILLFIHINFEIFFFLNFPLFIELKFYLGHFLSSSPYLIYYVGTHNDKNLFPLTYLQQPKIALHHSISITIITMEKLEEKEKTGFTHTKKSKWILEK